MNKQEIFNKSYLALKAQGKMSSIDNYCIYHNKSTGDCCAVGHLISKEIANEWDSLDGSTAITDIIKFEKARIEPWMKTNVIFLKDLQVAHDGLHFGWNHPKFGFEAKFRKLAENYGLTVPTGE
jgi:hypothetical protein